MKIFDVAKSYMCLLEKFFEYVEAFLYVIHPLLLLTWYHVIVIQQNQFIQLMAELETKINKRRTNISTDEIYENSDEKCVEMVHKANIIVLRILGTCFAVSAILESLYKYFSSNCSHDSFKQLAPATFPFDWRTPTGYLICCLIQVPITHITAYLFICVFSIIIGFCLPVTATIADLESNLCQINDNICKLTSEIDKTSQLTLKRTLLGIFQVYFEAKEISLRFSDACMPIICPYLIYTIGCFCSLFLQMKNFLTDFNLMSAMQIIGPTLVAISWLYIFCHFGNHLTQRFSDFGESVYQFNWYMLPLDMQKDLPIFFVMAQKNIFLHGYGQFECTCEVFMKILKTTLSYFLVLQQF